MFTCRSRARVSYRTFASLALATSVAVLAPADPASAMPTPADLAVKMTATPTEIPVTGDIVDTAIDVTNRGGSVANDITLTIRLPAGAAPAYDTDPSPWQCTRSEWVMTCTHPSLAAGESAAHLAVPLGVPAGTDGESVELVAEVATGSIELFTDDNSSQATITYDADRLIPDLYVARRKLWPSHYVIPGDMIRFAVTVGNSGSTAANDVVVRLTVPPALSATWGPNDWSDPAWQCAALSTPHEWECQHGSLAAGAIAGDLSFSARVPDGTPGENLPIVATVRTSTEGDDLRDNALDSGYEYAPRTIVRGQFWKDVDQDGQRDPGEETVAVDAQVSLVPVNGGGLKDLALIDGVYSGWVRADQYRLQVYLPSGSRYQFTTANVGNDATDSDVRLFSGPDCQQGESDEFFLSWGDEIVLDVGLVDAAS